MAAPVDSSGESSVESVVASAVTVRPATDRDRRWIRMTLTLAWGSSQIAVHDDLFDATTLPAFVAERDGAPVGLLTWRDAGTPEAPELEAVTLDSLAPGAGTALLYAFFELAVERGARAYLVTTANNVRAIGIYTRRGMRLARIDLDAVDRSRVAHGKDIPAADAHGVPIRDELTFEWVPGPAEEVVDLCAPDGTVIGVAPRSQVRRRNLLHAATGIVVRDPAGRVYIHRRTATKDVYPGRYDLCAGGVLQAGEEPLASAQRELAEELGITGAPLEPLATGFFEDQATRYVAHLFTTTWDGPIRHQPSEVDWGAWVDLAELRRRVADQPDEWMPDALALLGDHLGLR